MPNPNAALLHQTNVNKTADGDDEQTQTAGNPTISSNQQQQSAQNKVLKYNLFFTQLPHIKYIKPHTQLPHLLVARHPVVGQLSTKATVLAKMLVRAMQLLLWAGDRRVNNDL